MLLTLAGVALPGLILVPAPASPAPAVAEEQEQSIKDAVKAVSNSVVKIETSGGTEVVKAGRGPRGIIRRGQGPTTGLIVSADGYVVSSAFNFADKPATIRVAVPGMKERK